MLLSLMSLLQVASAEEIDSIPEVWVQCNPISGLMDLERMLPDSYRETTKGLGEIGMEGFERLGGDPNGRLVASGSEGLTMQIPFSGEAGSVSELLSVLQTDAIVWQTGPAEWALELVDDHWTATLKEGHLEIQSLVSPSTVEAPSVLSSISDVETAQGCWVMVSSDMNIPKTKIPLDGGVFLPFGEDPFSLLFAFDQQLPEFFNAQGALPMIVKTPTAPAIVLSLGFEWEELFADPEIQKRLGFTEKEAKKISKRLRIQNGGMVAFETMNVRKDPKISVALQLNNRFGKPQSEWLIHRGILRSLKQAELEYDKLDSNIVSFVNNGQVLYLGVDKGRLYAGNTKASIESMIRNEGVAWTDDVFNDFAQTQPLAVRVSIPDTMGAMVGGVDGVHVGLRKLDKYAQVTMHVNMTHDGGWMGLLPFLVGQLPEGTPNETISDGQRIVQQLAAKEHMVFAETGVYTPVGQTGIFESPDVSIPADLLDRAPVTTSASKLGWMQQPSDGIYWVETSDETFLVNGVFPLDGELVHLTKDHRGQVQIEMLSIQ